MSSAAKCCASAAEPPLPQASTLPPRFRVSASSALARAIGSVSVRAASSLSCALSANCALTRAESAAESASFTAPDSTPSLDEHLEFDAPGGIRVRRETADARLQRRSPIEAPGERGVVAPGHVAELAAAPGHRDRVGIVRVVRLALEPQGVADAKLVPHLLGGVIAKARERCALDQQSDAAGRLLRESPGGNGERDEEQHRLIRQRHCG